MDIRADFVGHVFNLSTPDGYFTIDSLYTGNSKNAYNNGAATNYREQGVEHVEIADGSGLGDICDEENGEVVTIDEFVARSDARHPQCTIAAIPVLDGLDEAEGE